MKIVVAIDSFKGSLTSTEAGQAAIDCIQSLFPNCQTELIPIADGGEGMLTVMMSTTQGHIQSLEAHNPCMEKITTSYGISLDGKTAFIEMASISGLPLIKKEQQDPMKTTTFGTGELIRDALERGCTEFIIGIGGSATNDGGTGMLSALGFRFLDKERNPLRGCGSTLAKIVSIDESQAMAELKDCEFVVACDVTAPLYGPNGAAHVFAPQKGADKDMVEKLDKGLMNFAESIRKFNGKDVTDIPGAALNDRVTLVGKDGSEEITMEAIAEKADSFNYEFVCGISRRVPRIYTSGGKTVHTVHYLTDPYEGGYLNVP